MKNLIPMIVISAMFISMAHAGDLDDPGYRQHTSQPVTDPLGDAVKRAFTSPPKLVEGGYKNCVFEHYKQLLDIDRSIAECKLQFGEAAATPVPVLKTQDVAIRVHDNQI